MEIFRKIKLKLMHMRLQPIRVFCFHHVSDTFDETTMHRGDWLQTDAFKHAIVKLQDEGYSFISLQEAHEKLKHDVFRFSKYAVLTADDGWGSLRNVLPWLNEQKIPVTLFLNPAYLDGKHFREHDTEKYLSWKDIKEMHDKYPLVTIGSHGWEHIDATKQTIDKFLESVRTANESLHLFPNFIPFYAYTWGRHTQTIDCLLREKHMTPVLIDDVMNYNNETIIQRELLK